MESNEVACETDNWCGLEEQRQNLEQYLSGRCRDMNEVDDVIQETLMRAARFRKKLERPERLRSWIAIIANNVLMDRKRKSTRIHKQSIEDYVFDLLPSKDSPDPVSCSDADVRFGNWLMKRDTVLDCLSGELRGMEHDDRELLLNFYGREQGGCREVAAEYGVTPNVVKMRLFRARNRLLKAVSRRFALSNQLPTPKTC
ncbi:MAG: RNA polymerase sigma factor (sigma-70 family) [Planctomycetota bacterium]|jgi:RNA polymerase sigma factor (sigma-70 family)